MTVQTEPLPNPERLRQRLSTSLAGYRVSRGDVSLDRALEAPTPELREVLGYWLIPRGALSSALPSEDLLWRAGWHAQIYLRPSAQQAARPKYYARCTHLPDREDWRVDWIGERWLAEPVARGIEWWDARDSELTGTVSILSSRRYGFSSLFLVPEDPSHERVHLVVSASERRVRLPLFEFISESHLAATLRAQFAHDGTGGMIRDEEARAPRAPERPQHDG